MKQYTLILPAVFLSLAFAYGHGPYQKSINNTVQIPKTSFGTGLTDVPASFRSSFNTSYKSTLGFEENKGQWPDQVEFKADLGGGRRVFFEKNKFTYVVYNPDDLYPLHEKEHHGKNVDEEIVKAHAFKMEFMNASPTTEVEGAVNCSFHYNYFIGNDPSKWASDVPVFKTLTYKNVYPGIDVQAYEQESVFKYDYIVQAGADAKNIQLSFEGVEKLGIQDKNLYIYTSVGNVIESIPYAFQIIDNKEVRIACEYQLADNGKTVSFYFPQGYDARYKLIIDPVLLASTYSGSLVNTYGHCATYDLSGNIYTGGRCFGVGYPASVGALQLTFGGGVDIAISKLNPSGSSLLYATYLGGNSFDYPHSMFVNTSNELYVLGSTQSSNYPVSSGCYDNSQNGQSDIIVSKLNTLGTVLLGSTYVGGSGNDGINNAASYNYGDTYRGEIIVSNAGDVYIASTTISSDFPVTTGAYDQTHNGLQDAVVFKMNNSLTNMQWSTYLGGSQNEAGCSIRVNLAGDVYVVGLTQGTGFPTVTGALHSTYQGGSYDGFVSRFNSSGTILLNSTFIGTAGADITYFVEVDIYGDVYIYGISTGSMPITAGVYSNSGSINYLNKLNPTLSSVIFGTVLGNGTTSSFSPSALMVDLCQNIYLAGWGSNSNYPITANATQSTTTGSNFHLMVLSPNAASLLFGSFFGSGGEHVDGGTSRFDPSGVVYQAVCACGSSFPTLPTAYSPTKVSSGCDIVVFKIDFQVNCNPLYTNTLICNGSSAYLNILNVNGLVNPSYSIQPGGIISTTSSFTVSPSVTTSYTIFITGTNSFNALVTNTGVSTVSVAPRPQLTPSVTQASCISAANGFNLGLTFVPGGSTPSYTVFWSPIPFGVLSPTQTSSSGGIAAGVYNATVTTADGCATSTVFTMNPAPTSVSFAVTGPNTITCSNPTVTLLAAPANYTYSWSGTTAVYTGASASFTAGQNGIWTVLGTDPVTGCVGAQTINIGQNISTTTSTVAPLFQNITCSVTSIITVTAQATPSVNSTHYWISPTGGTLTMNSNPAMFQPGIPGIYTHVVVNDANGCSVSKTFTVTSASGFPTFSVTSPQNFTLGCGSTSVANVNIINAQTTPTAGGSISYTLLAPNYSTSYGTGSISSYPVSMPGTWTVITRDNANFCESKIQISILQNTFAPSINVIAPLTRLTCFTPSVLLQGVSNTPNTYFNWSFPGTPGNVPGSTITVNVNSAQPNNTLVANFTLTVTDANNTCKSFSVVPIEQNTSRPTANIGGGNSISCKTATIMLTNLSSTSVPPVFNPSQYVVAQSWQGPSPQTEAQLVSTYIAGTPGTYTMIAMDLNNGCTSVAQKTITDGRDYPNVEITETPFILDCGSIQQPIYPTVTNNSSFLSYQWTAIPGASVTSLNTPSISVNREGQYNVIITNTVSGCASHAMVEVINGTLQASFVADQAFGYAPFAVNFTNTSASSSTSSPTTNITSFWNFGNGMSLPSIKQNTLAPIVYSQPGTYTVTLFAYKGNCMDTATATIRVELPSDLVIPNIFTPNGDGTNDLFFVKATNLERIDMLIVDRWGHKVYEVSSDKGNISWDGKNQEGKEVAEGVYVYTLRASGKDGREYNKKGNVSLVR